MIDLNADMGEGSGNDAALMALVSSASIACGGHAGDIGTMRRTIRLAKEHGVRIGAHPGFADPEHFGRRRLDMSRDALQTQLTSQMCAIAGIAAEEGATLSYVKLHGAMANMAAEDVDFASSAFEAIQLVVPGVKVLALDNSAQVTAAEQLGLGVIREAYVDRAYTPDGLLAGRDLPNAVMEDVSRVIAQCLRLAQQHEIVAIDGSIMSSQARSICLHGDNPAAVKLAYAVRDALVKSGISISNSD